MTPNDFAVVERVYHAGNYNLVTEEGQAAFVDAVVMALHAHDKRWGHLKKNPGQSNIHGHAEDAALYLSDTPGQSTAVDFIGGAGGPAPVVQWNPDQPRYSKSDWLDPKDHDTLQQPPAPPVPPAAPTFPYPDENTVVKAYQERIRKAYSDAGRSFPDPNDSDAFRHFVRYGYDCRSMPEPESANKHIAELRAALGIGPE